LPPGRARVGGVRAPDGRRAVLQLHDPSGIGAHRSSGCVRDRSATRPRRDLRDGSTGGPPVRMDCRGRVATRTPPGSPRGRASCRRNGYAWPMDPARLERGGANLASTQPALCINKSESGQPSDLPGAQRASFPGGRAPFRGAPQPSASGGALTTDRLVTTFHASRAQSGPRKVSPMNFTGGSRSIQRLLAARPLLTCWSRGRA
jgi:hypothetical protein